MTGVTARPVGAGLNNGELQSAGGIPGGISIGGASSASQITLHSGATVFAGISAKTSVTSHKLWSAIKRPVKSIGVQQHPECAAFTDKAAANKIAANISQSIFFMVLDSCQYAALQSDDLLFPRLKRKHKV